MELAWRENHCTSAAAGETKLQLRTLTHGWKQKIWKVHASYWLKHPGVRAFVRPGQSPQDAARTAAAICAKCSKLRMQLLPALCCWQHGTHSVPRLRALGPAWHLFAQSYGQGSTWRACS